MSPAAHSLMPMLIDPRWLRRAARACMRQRSAPGPDGITWARYRENLAARLDDLAHRLSTDTWQPRPPWTAGWPSWGKTLIVCVPTVEDRIVHRALRQAAEPVLDRDAYPPWLFGWRPRHSKVEAVAAAARHLESGRRWVADVDVAAVTTGGSVEGVLDQLAVHIHDGSFLHIMRRALDALPSPLAAGSGLSPMLTNVRLLNVDERLADLRVVRMTDNYTAFCTTPDEAEHAMELITEALALAGLRPNADKSKVWRPNPEDLYLAG